MNIAKLEKRVIAELIDYSFVFVLSLALILFFNNYYLFNEADELINNSLYKTRGFLIALAIDFIYTTYLLEGHMQATFGMRILKIKIVTTNGEKPDVWTLILRYFVSIFSSVTLKLGYVYALFNNKKQTVHDYFLGTIVIDVENSLSGMVGTPSENYVITNKEIVEKKINEEVNLSYEIPKEITDKIWDSIGNEYESPNRKNGLYSKLYVELEGNEVKIKVAYLKIRFSEICTNYIKNINSIKEGKLQVPEFEKSSKD